MGKYLYITFEEIGDKTNRNLGGNVAQRLYYIDFLHKTVKRNEPVPDFLVGRTVEINSSFLPFKLIELIYKTKNFDCIVTERNIDAVAGLLSKVIFKKKWITDLPDCPFKECTSRYKRKPIKWILSFAKSVVLYKIMNWSDVIIISYSKERFCRYYNGDMSKVFFFFNAIPIDKTRCLHAKIHGEKGRYTFVYIGVDFREYGIDLFLEYLKRYLKNNNKISIDFYIIGHKRDETATMENLRLINHERLKRNEVLDIISASDLGVVPFLKGSDIYYTFPIKSLEFFVYGRKILLADTYGMRELFKNTQSEDLYFFNAESYDDFEKTLSRILRDIDSDIFDSNKIDKIYKFDAEKKNSNIRELYKKCLL